MSAYAAGRRGPNVSQYLQGLNTVPAPQDMAPQQDNFGLDDDLALFTNTEFFDFDLGTEIPEVTQAPPFDYDPMAEERARRRNASTASSYNHDFSLNGGDFQTLDFSSFPVGVPDPNFSHQPNPYPIQQHQHGTNTSSPLSAASPTTTAGGNKRKLDGLSIPTGAPTAQSVEELSRVAAEEDKRRRNTAASARFRIKKKQREQQLEKTAKEMTDKVTTLEQRVAQLEMENKWLKGLITEKNDGKGAGDIAELYRRFMGSDKEKEERSNGERTDGVGTKTEKA